MTPGGDIVQQVDIDNPLLPNQGGSYRCVAWVQEIKDYVYSQPVNIDNGELLLQNLLTCLFCSMFRITADLQMHT